MDVPGRSRPTAGTRSPRDRRARRRGQRRCYLSGQWRARLHRDVSLDDAPSPRRRRALVRNKPTEMAVQLTRSRGRTRSRCVSRDGVAGSPSSIVAAGSLARRRPVRARRALFGGVAGVASVATLWVNRNAVSSRYGRGLQGDAPPNSILGTVNASATSSSRAAGQFGVEVAAYREPVRSRWWQRRRGRVRGRDVRRGSTDAANSCMGAELAAAAAGSGGVVRRRRNAFGVRAASAATSSPRGYSRPRTRSRTCGPPWWTPATGRTSSYARRRLVASTRRFSDGSVGIALRRRRARGFAAACRTSRMRSWASGRKQRSRLAPSTHGVAQADDDGVDDAFA